MSSIALQESFKLIMGRLVILLKDFEGMLRIGKLYTGKLESSFATVSSKRLSAVEQDLRKLLAGPNFQSAEQFLTSTFVPAMSSFLQSAKSAVNGDFSEVDTRIHEVRRLSINLVQLMKECFEQVQSYSNMKDSLYVFDTQLLLPQKQSDTPTRSPNSTPMSARLPSPTTPTASSFKKKK